MKAKIIRVSFRPGEHGLLVATSADLKGLYVVGQSHATLHDEVPLAIEALFAAKGVKVVVHEAEDEADDILPWVAVPLANERTRAT